MKSKNKPHHPAVSTPSIPSTPPTTADENAQQAFLWHTHDYLANYARFADTKAAFAGALAGALIGALYGARLLTPLGHEHWKTWPLAVWLALPGSATLATSILFALRVVYPRLKSAGAQGYIFWGNIAAFTSVAELATSFEAQTTKTLNAQLLRQNHDISRYVCIPKYRNVSWCIITLFIGGLLTAAAFLTQATLPQPRGRALGDGRQIPQRRGAREAEAATAASTLDPEFARNVAALKAVQPEDLLPGDISARLGSSWIPATDIRDFVVRLLDVPERSVAVSHAGAIASWSVTLDDYAKSKVGNTTTHGTALFTAGDLIEQALNGRVPTAYDEMPDKSRVLNQRETFAAREKQQQLKDRFAEWIWQDEPRATRLARSYNDTFNHLRLRTFDGSHLTFPRHGARAPAQP